MKLGDSKYNKLFREMILTGICCGCIHPVEILINYDRDPYTCIDLDKEIFKELVGKELCFWDRYSDGSKNSINEITIQEVQDWIDKHYQQGKYENKN